MQKAKSERRRYKRVPLACPTTLVSEAAHVHGRTIDISDGGLYLPVSPQKAPGVGQECDVDLLVPRSTANSRMLEQFTGRARVVRVDDGKECPSSGVALAFIEPIDLALEV